MGYVLMAFRETHLVQRKNNLEAKLIEIMKKKSDLHKYSSAIASDGILSIKELASMPISCFGLAYNYATNGHASIMQNTLNRGVFAIYSQYAEGLRNSNPMMREEARRLMCNEANFFTQALNNPEYVREFQNAQFRGKINMSNPTMQQLANAIYLEEAIKKQMAKEQMEAEKERIKAMEDDLDMEKTQIETQLSAVRQELQSVGEGKKQDIQSEVAKYA